MQSLQNNNLISYRSILVNKIKIIKYRTFYKLYQCISLNDELVKIKIKCYRFHVKALSKFAMRNKYRKHLLILSTRSRLIENPQTTTI